MIQENKSVQKTLNLWQGLFGQYEELQVLVELVEEEDDVSMLPEIGSLIDKLEESIEDVEFQQMLSGEHDTC